MSDSLRERVETLILESGGPMHIAVAILYLFEEEQRAMKEKAGNGNGAKKDD